MVRFIVPGVIMVGLAIGSTALGAGARVAMQDGVVTAQFEATPVPEALNAVKRATGVEIVLPASVLNKSLTLTVERVPFEQFVRQVLDRLELGGFALVYEATGAAQRVIVVDRARGGPSNLGSAAPAAEPSPTTGAGSEPVYVPPATPPVYIPPATPPVYIPPVSPPVYVPPATEPQEVAPSR